MVQRRAEFIVSRFTCVLILMLAGCNVKTRQQVISLREVTPIPIAQNSHHDNELNRLAFARFHMLKSVGDQASFRIGSFIASYDAEAVFPAGRADRVYLLESNEVYCYQHKDGKDKCLYHITMPYHERAITADTPVVQPRIHCLLDYLTQEQEFGEGLPNSPHTQEIARQIILPPAASAYARHDLTTKRDYVDYGYDDFEEQLSVTWLNDENTGLGLGNAIYCAERFPIGAESSPKGSFYKEYGLPTIPIDELALEASSHPADKPHSYKPRIETQAAISLGHARCCTLLSVDNAAFYAPHASFNAIHFLSGSTETIFPTNCTVLFPLGQADRIYVCNWTNAYTEGSEDYHISCYQMKDDKSIQVYQIHLQLIQKPSARPAQIRSLLDYLQAAELVTTTSGISEKWSFAITGSLSPEAKADLTLQRPYVQYSLNSKTNLLDVWRIGDSKTMSLSMTEHYDVSSDPITHKPIPMDFLFNEYGLPTASGEE